MRFLLKHLFNQIKDLGRNDLLIILFTLFYIVFFTIIAFYKSNFEFVYYTVTFLFLLDLGVYVHRRVQLPAFIVVGLSALGLMHILGGNILLSGSRLYEKIFLYGLLRYDNIIHFIGSALGTFVINEIFWFFVKKDQKITLSLYYFSLFLMGLGAGVLNEIIELIAVLYFNAQGGVGDYLNNAIDMVYNAVGVVVAIILIDIDREYKANKYSRLHRFMNFFKNKFQKPNGSRK